MLQAHGQITKTIGESGRGVVVEKVVRGRKTEFGLAGDSKSHGCLWEIKAALASIAGLLKPILKLQAATRDDDTRICDLRPVCGDRGLRIGAASLTLRLESESSRRDRKEQYKGGPRHAQDNKGAIRISGLSARSNAATFSLCLSYMSRVQITRGLSFGAKSEHNWWALALPPSTAQFSALSLVRSPEL